MNFMETTPFGHISYASIYAFLLAAAISTSMLEGLVYTFVLRKNYDWKAAFASLAIAIGRRLTDLAPIALALPGAAWLYDHRLLSWSAGDPLAWVVLFFALEFSYYCFHRACHRVRWFWMTHAVHHSPNQFNLSAAYRLGWTGKYTFILIFFVPLALLGFPPQMILLVFAWNLLYQFWIHAEWIPRLGFLEGVINTPSAHRVHHASNLEYLDANYGGVLLIFDRLFGTYTPEKRDVPIRYGWVQPIASVNPFRLAFQQWIDGWKDVRRAKNLREVAGYLFAPPGWQPDGNGQTTEDLRKAKQDESKV